jgi:hypothetical protein
MVPVDSAADNTFARASKAATETKTLRREIDIMVSPCF